MIHVGFRRPCTLRKGEENVKESMAAGIPPSETQDEDAPMTASSGTQLL